MTNPTPEALAELKACPFCGGDELSHGWDAPGIDGSATTGNVQCHSCDALLWRATEAEAITAWNTRPEPRHPARDPLPDAVERLARALCHDEAAREIAGQALADAYEDSEPEVQEYWRCIARAVLSAMPASSGEVGQVTPEMIQAGYRIVERHPGPASYHDCKRIIEAALAVQAPHRPQPGEGEDGL